MEFFKIVLNIINPTRYKLACLAFLFLITQDSCKKDPPYACGVEHPEINLSWLTDLFTRVISVDVYDYSFQGNEYLIVTNEEIVFDGLAVAYNCQGQILCQYGGINPGIHSCTLSDPEHFWETYRKDRKLICQLRNQKIVYP